MKQHGSTLESQFLKPPSQTGIGSSHQEFEKSGVKNYSVWTEQILKGMNYGSSYPKVQEIKASKKQDFTELFRMIVAILQ